MGQISLQIPQVGLPNSTEQPKEASAFTTLQNVINGNLDSSNLAAGAVAATSLSSAVAQSAGVNQAGQVSKGVTVNAGPGTRTNIAYGALNDAADQVTGIVLPANGLIAVWFQGVWSESVSSAGQAAIFLGANQVVFATGDGTPAAQTQAQFAGIGASNIATPLTTFWGGLWSTTPTHAYSGDVTTGQIVGNEGPPSTLGSGTGKPPQGATAAAISGGGPCYIFAAAGTYNVSVQYKASVGNTVTATNRKLWVRAFSFA